MGGQFKAWLQLVRPFTLIAPFVAVFFGVVIQLSAYGNLSSFFPNIHIIIFASLALSAAQAVGQILNQVEDVEIDIANNKDYRPIPSGKISIEKAELAAWVLAIFAILGSFSINMYYGIFILLFLFFGTIYNIEPFRLKRRLWMNTASLAICRGLMPLPAAWSIFGNPFDASPWLLGSIMGLWVLAWQNTKDLNDIEGDKKYGVITPAVYHNFKTLTKIIGILSFIAFFLLAIYIKYGLLPSNMITLFLLSFPTIWMLYRMARNRVTLTSLENNDLWASFYLVLASFYIIAAATYLAGPYLTLFS